jgi:multidrug resistance protein MdtO
MSAASSSANFILWPEKLWEDLQPTPGRLNSSLRITLATVLALLLILVWQMPFAAIGLYSIFLIGRESPSASLRLGVASVMTIALAVAIELAVVVLTDNDPIARVLSVAAIAFLAGMVVVATSLPALGPSWGLIYSIVIAFWESHLPPDRLVKNSLWLFATFSLAVACAVAVEYVFGGRSPADRLQEQLRIRYRALERMFSLYAQEVAPEQRFEAASTVSRLAVAGQAGMMALYNQIVDRNLDSGALPIATRVHITMLAELMDESAAFGLQSDMSDDSQLRQRCARIAEQCRALIRGASPEGRFEPGPRATNSLLDRVEGAIHSIVMMPSDVSPATNKALAALPSKKVPFFIPGAFRDRDNVAFSLKVSLCATLCYILYLAIDWPGTSSSVITVMAAGLTTTGAMKQRLTFRLLGATVGGLILGLGATAFVFPELDSITSLVIVVGSVALLAAWISGGRRFNYVGIQLAFAFYIVAFEGFSAPTQLAPARDRLFGILFALVVMWFVFDQIWPVRTVTAMRRVLASVLRSGASLFRMLDSASHDDQIQREIDGVRDRVGKNISALRTMSEAVEYEFGVDREHHVRTSEVILRSSLAAAALIWNQVAVLHGREELDFLAEPALAEVRGRLADRLNMLAEAVERKTSLPTEHLGSFVSRHLLENEHYGEYVRNTIARYKDLQTLSAQLGGEI